MHQRARVAADRAKNPESKKNLHAAEKVYKAFIEKMKKITKERQKMLSKIKSYIECLLVKLGLKKKKIERKKKIRRKKSTK